MYAVDPYSGLYALRIAPDGQLTNLPESPYPAGDEPYQAAITPNGKYLYVPDYSNDNVNGYSLDADGAPTPLPGSPFAGVDDPYGGLEVSPDGRTLYVSGSDAIEHLAIAEDGALTAGDPVSVGAYNPSLALNPAGTRLYNVSQNGDDLLTTYTRSDSGVLTALGTPLDLADNPSPDTDSLVVSPAQPPAAALEADVAGKRVVSFDASASADSDGEIVSYAWDFGDGSTATTTTPTTTHKYAKDGRFTATVTVTDADNCSSELVYASRNTYCNGSDVATAEAVADSGVEGAKVKAKKTQKQKRKLLIKVKAGAKEAVRLQARGSAKVKGLKGKVKLKQAKGKAKAGKTKVLKLKAKSKKKGKAAAGRKGKATVKVELTDEYGATASKKVKVKLK